MSKRGKFINGDPDAPRDCLGIGIGSNVFVGYFPKGVLAGTGDIPQVSFGATHNGITLGPTVVTLKEFLFELGITIEDVAKALYGGETHD